MGADVTAHAAHGGSPVPPDDYRSEGLYVSIRANLCAHMTWPWYDKKRDGSDIGCGSYQRDIIHEESFRQANEVIPWTLDGYVRWARVALEEEDPLGFSVRGRITQEDFDAVRDFIRECALNGRYASYSY